MYRARSLVAERDTVLEENDEDTAGEVQPTWLQMWQDGLGYCA